MSPVEIIKGVGQENDYSFDIKESSFYVAFKLFENRNLEFPKVISSIKGELESPDKFKVIKRELSLLEALCNLISYFSTPYGWFVINTLISQSRLVQGFLLRISISLDQFKLKFPLMSWFSMEEKGWKEIITEKKDNYDKFEIIYKSLVTWRVMDKYLNGITGRTTIKYKNVKSGFELIENWLNGEGSKNLPEIKKEVLDRYAVPMEGGIPVGGDNIISGISFLNSLLYLEKLKKEINLEFPSHMLINVTPFETKALEIYNTKLATGIFEHPYILYTALGLFELSLMTPLHPLFAPLRKGLTWEDLHPGFRVKKCIEISKEENIVLETLEVWAYREFINKICKKAGWPEPAQFIEILKKEEVRKGGGIFYDYFMQNMLIREINPVIYLDIYSNLHELTEVIRPIKEIENFTSSEYNEFITWLGFELTLIDLMYQLLFSVDGLKLHLSIFEPLIEAFGGVDEIIKTYFGIEFKN